jgi:hypothetical protein
MTTDFRALCAELLAAIQLYTKLNPAAYEMSASELTGKLMDAMAATTAALAQSEPVDMIARIDTLLDGIDRDECHPDGGWWQTSDGSKFGRIKLRELKELVSAAHLAKPQPDPVAPTDEQWDALKERVWDQYQTNGYQGERFMYNSDFDTALDVVRQKLTRWGTPANNTGETH